MESIEFNKVGYDPQIDYIKGVCIIFIIWTHCISRDELGYMLFPYWGDTAVPIFLIIQVFHYFKKGILFRMPRIAKLWKRIIMPFIIMIGLMFFVQFFIYYDTTCGTFSPILYWDMRGPGSYYIFIYLELAFTIPMFASLFKKLSVKWLFVIFVILSQLVELTCSVTKCPDYIFRIIFFRYIFLIYLGFLLATKGLELNSLTILSGIISIIFIYIFAYTKIDLEPVFCTHLALWPLCHWVCYIYIAYFFLTFLIFTYSIISRYHIFANYIEKIGKYSYEIYLFQIFYYATFSIYIGKALVFIGHYPTQRILYVLLSTAICVIPIVYLKKKMSH